jgi:hypothetical protein
MNTITELARYMSHTDKVALAQLLARAIHETAPKATLVGLVRNVDIAHLCELLDDLAPRKMQDFLYLIG